MKSESSECSGISVCILFTEGENTQLHTNCIHRKILELASSVMLLLYIIYFVMRKNYKIQQYLYNFFFGKNVKVRLHIIQR